MVCAQISRLANSYCGYAGVLTKPDRIEEGNERVWHQILRKRDWFCVKQPNSLELQRKISWEEARHNEKDYFKTNDYWRGVERRIQDRMGTNSLAHHLGIRLFDLIEKRYIFLCFFHF